MLDSCPNNDHAYRGRRRLKVARSVEGLFSLSKFTFLTSLVEQIQEELVIAFSADWCKSSNLNSSTFNLLSHASICNLVGHISVICPCKEHSIGPLILQTGDMKCRPGNGIEGAMVCTSFGSLLRPQFYFQCSILLIHRVVFNFSTCFVIPIPLKSKR